MIWGSCLENSKLGSSKSQLKNRDILLLIAETQLLVQYFHKDWFSHALYFRYLESYLFIVQIFCTLWGNM